MGITGVGKTYFISKATGRDLALGNSLESSTTEIQRYEFELRGLNIILLDTPGFDDRQKPDIVLLEEFVRYLQRLSMEGIGLAGIIYLHRINDNRMQGSAQTNLHLLTELCGDDFLKHVILVTTMWDCTEEKIGLAREEMLKTKFWKPLIDKKATVERFRDDRYSAGIIISKLLKGLSSDEVVPDILREGYSRTSVSETKAGRVLMEDKIKKLEKLDRQLDNLREIEKEMMEKPSWEIDGSEIEQIRMETLELTKEKNKLRVVLEKYSDASYSPPKQEEKSLASFKEAQPPSTDPNQRDHLFHDSGAYSPHDTPNKTPAPFLAQSLAEGSGIPPQKQSHQSKQIADLPELNKASSVAHPSQTTAPEGGIMGHLSTYNHPQFKKWHEKTKFNWDPVRCCWIYHVWYHEQWKSGWCQGDDQRQNSPPEWRYRDRKRDDSQNSALMGTPVHEGMWEYTVDHSNWHTVLTLPYSEVVGP